MEYLPYIRCVDDIKLMLEYFGYDSISCTRFSKDLIEMGISEENWVASARIIEGKERSRQRPPIPSEVMQILYHTAKQYQSRSVLMNGSVALHAL